MIRYVVEGQATGEAGWCPVSSCNSPTYARLLAAIGLRRRIGLCYRLVDTQTGSQTALAPEPQRKAA